MFNKKTKLCFSQQIESKTNKQHKIKNLISIEMSQEPSDGGISPEQVWLILEISINSSQWIIGFKSRTKQLKGPSIKRKK